MSNEIGNEAAFPNSLFRFELQTQPQIFPSSGIFDLAFIETERKR